MAYIKKEGFDFLDDLNGEPEFFVLKGDTLEKELNYIQKNKIKSIYLNYFDSIKIENLNFLKEISFIEKVNFNGIDLDYSGLYYLNNLKYAITSIKNKRQHLDYSKFKKLEYLSIDWYPQFPDLTENDSLKELIIWKFKPKSKSFSDIKLPKGLKNLEITESNISNIEGLKLDNLEKFEGHYCNQLLSVKGIKDIRNSLKIFILDYCRNLSDYDDLSYCHALNKLILGNCGNIQTLKWIEPLKNINYFSFWNTTVIDGNISPCLGIDYVRFKDQKHYNHKSSKFLP